MAQEYDKIIRENIEAVILPLFHKLLNIHPVRVQTITLNLQETIERKPDFTKIITTRGQKQFILHLEFQVKDERKMVLRMQFYKSMLQMTHELPVLQFVIYLGKQLPKMPQKLSKLIRGERTNYGFTLKSFREYDHKKLLKSTIPEEIILAILGNFRNEAPNQIISKITQQLQKIVKSNLQLQKYLKQLTILARLRKLEKETIKIIKTMPIEYNFEEDYLYQEGIEKGIEQGIEKGIEQGIEKGIERGIEKGIEQGIEKGIEQGIEKGIEQGIEKGKQALIIEMLKDGISPDRVAKISQVPVVYILKLQKEIFGN